MFDRSLLLNDGLLFIFGGKQSKSMNLRTSMWKEQNAPLNAVVPVFFYQQSKYKISSMCHTNLCVVKMYTYASRKTKKQNEHKVHWTKMTHIFYWPIRKYKRLYAMCTEYIYIHIYIFAEDIVATRSVCHTRLSLTTLANNIAHGP